MLERTWSPGYVETLTEPRGRGPDCEGRKTIDGRDGHDAAQRVGGEDLRSCLQLFDGDRGLAQGKVGIAKDPDHPGTGGPGKDPPVERRRADPVVEHREQRGGVRLEHRAVAVEHEQALAPLARALEPASV